MTKDQLQQELKEKIKEGIKPSDLKKKKLEEDEGYSSGEEEATNRDKSPLKNTAKSTTETAIPTPPLPNTEIKNLQTKIQALERQIQIYQDFKEVDLKIKTKQKKEIEEYKQIISNLQNKISEQYKTIQALKNQIKNPAKDKEKPLKTETEESKEKYYLFTCDICETNRKSRLHRHKVNGLGIDPNKVNKICDYCINKVDINEETEQKYKFE